MTVSKPHGSCNFLPTEIEATRDVSYQLGMTWGTRIQAVSLEDAKRYCDSDTALYPAMAMIAPGKPIQVGPEMIEQTQAYWRDAVAAAPSIVIIGVRPHSPDEHIWGPIAQAAGALYFVGDLSAFADWATKFRPTGGCVQLGTRFEASIRAIADAVAT